MNYAGNASINYGTIYRLTPLGGGIIKNKYGAVLPDAQSVHRKHYIPERQYDDSKISNPPKRPQSQYRVNYRGVCIWVISLALIAFGGALETRFGIDPVVWICVAIAIVALVALDTAVKGIRERRA